MRIRAEHCGPKNLGDNTSMVDCYFLDPPMDFLFPSAFGLRDLVSEVLISGKSKRGRRRDYTREVPEQRAAECHESVALESRFPHSNLGTEPSQVAEFWRGS